MKQHNEDKKVSALQPKTPEENEPRSKEDLSNTINVDQNHQNSSNEITSFVASLVPNIPLLQDMTDEELKEMYIDYLERKYK